MRNQDTAVLLSIKPQYARSILARTKTVELRRVFGNVDEGTLIVFYASSPWKSFVGCARIAHIERGSPALIWRRNRSFCGIASRDFWSYYCNADTAIALHLIDIEQFENPISITAVRKQTKAFVVPQSYRWLRPKCRSDRWLLDRAELACQ